MGCIYGPLFAALPEFHWKLRFKGIGRCVIGRHLGFELGRGACYGALQFAEGRVVPAVAACSSRNEVLRSTVIRISGGSYICILGPASIQILGVGQEKSCPVLHTFGDALGWQHTVKGGLGGVSMSL